MKKLLSIIILVALLIASLTSCQAILEELFFDDSPNTPPEIEESGELAFSLNADKNSYSVVGIGTSTCKNIVIPRTYKDLPVTAIADEAFKSCQFIKSIVIPDSVISIGKYAFDNCCELTNVELGEDSQLASLGIGAFEFTAITSFNIPRSVTSIPISAFAGCDFTSIEIPDSVTSIDAMAFQDCDKLERVTIPDSVISLGEAPFGGCAMLNTIIVDEANENYKSIDGSLYTKDGTKIINYATGKKDGTFEIPDHVTCIGSSAFAGSENLADIVIPTSVITIESDAFGSCTSLKNVTIPNSVISIGEKAFLNSGLESITLSSSVTTIGDYAFAYCKSLKNVIFAEEGNLTSLGNFAFQECTSLVSIEFPDYLTIVPEYVCVDCTSLKSVKLPLNVTLISTGAFKDCRSLNNITYPGNVKQFKEDVIRGTYWSTHTNLYYVYCSDGKYQVQ